MNYLVPWIKLNIWFSFLSRYEIILADKTKRIHSGSVGFVRVQHCTSPDLPQIDNLVLNRGGESNFPHDALICLLVSSCVMRRKTAGRAARAFIAKKIGQFGLIIQENCKMKIITQACSILPLYLQNDLYLQWNVNIEH